MENPRNFTINHHYHKNKNNNNNTSAIKFLIRLLTLLLIIVVKVKTEKNHQGKCHVGKNESKALFVSSLISCADICARSTNANQSTSCSFQTEKSLTKLCRVAQTTHSSESNSALHTTFKVFPIRLKPFENSTSHPWLSETKNLALNKPAFLSTTLRFRVTNKLAKAKYAVEGRTSNRMNKNDRMECASSDHQRNPWFLIDLQLRAIVRSVYIINRNAMKDRLHNFDIVIMRSHPGNTNYTYTTEEICKYFPGNFTDRAEVPCDSAKEGRFVFIKMRLSENKDKEILTLCEVEVRGLSCG